MEIIVNGKTKHWVSKEITYNEVLILAYGNTLSNYNALATITYSKGENKSKGNLIADQKVNTIDGMIFNALVTDKS